MSGWLGAMWGGHAPYETLLGRRPDFRVRYKFFSPNRAGTTFDLFQGVRPDFWYDHPEHHKDNLFIIWPEFEDERGKIIDKNNSVSETGTARMWIIDEKLISYHRGKIAIGTKGYFREGGHSYAECEVIELINILIKRE
jgi:hypothetical protein